MENLLGPGAFYSYVYWVSLSILRQRFLSYLNFLNHSYIKFIGFIIKLNKWGYYLYKYTKNEYSVHLCVMINNIQAPHFIQNKCEHIIGNYLCLMHIKKYNSNIDFIDVYIYYFTIKIYENDLIFHTKN